VTDRRRKTLESRLSTSFLLLKEERREEKECGKGIRRLSVFWQLLTTTTFLSSSVLCLQGSQDRRGMAVVKELAHGFITLDGWV
jgi:hypothetical protein